MTALFSDYHDGKIKVFDTRQITIHIIQCILLFLLNECLAMGTVEQRVKILNLIKLLLVFMRIRIIFFTLISIEKLSKMQLKISMACVRNREALLI